MDMEVIVRFSNRNLGNYIEDYFVGPVNFSEVEPKTIIEKLTDIEINDYILYVKRFLGIKDCKFFSKHKICLYNEKKNRLLKDDDVSKVFYGYEELQIFRENIKIWDCAIEFIECLANNGIFPNFSRKKNVCIYLIVAILIIHKYHIDDSYGNSEIADYFSLNIKKLNLTEMKILKKFNYHLPIMSLYKYKIETTDFTYEHSATIINESCTHKLDNTQQDASIIQKSDNQVNKQYPVSTQQVYQTSFKSNSMLDSSSISLLLKEPLKKIRQRKIQKKMHENKIMQNILPKKIK